MEFKEHLLAHLPEKEVESLLLSLERERVYALLLNTKKMSDETFLSLFPNVRKHPFVPHAYLYEKQEYEFGKSVFYDAGCYSIQDPAAMMAVYFLSPKEGETVLDLCAAPGGKSIALSFAIGDSGVLIANDLSYPRAKDLSQNVERMGLGNVIVTCNDFSKIYTHYLERFSSIMLDAPCSGSAMFRKNDLAKEDWRYEKVLSCSSRQKELLEMAYQMLSPGGKLLYSTCSFSYEEDEEPLLELKKNHPELEFVPLLKDERFYSHPDLKEGIRLLPNRFEGEGQFIALLKKPGEVEIHHEKAGKPLKQFLKELEAYGLEERDNLILHDGIESLPRSFDIRPLNVLRYGVRAFDFKEKLVLPAHHLAHYLDAKESISLNEEELAKYIGGETLNLKAKDGWNVVSFQGANLGWVKAKNNVAKNHYPKGLRRKLKR